MPRKTDTAFEVKGLKEKIDRRYLYKDQKVIHVLVPKNLRSTSLLKIKPPSITDDKTWTNSVFYIVSSIISLTQKKRFKGGNKTKGYVSLKATELRKILGVSSKLILDTLEDAGVIEIDNSYAVSVESKGYRLKTKYRKSPVTFVTITDAKIVQKYNTQAKLYNALQREKLRDKAYLVKWFLDDKLKIDNVKALKYLELYESIVKRHLTTYDVSKKSQQEMLSHIDSSIQSSKSIIENWHTRNITFDSKGERLYSSLTSIMSQLRCFTTYEEQELVSFDIKNSQPFHILLLLNPRFWDKPKRKTDVVMENLNSELLKYLKDNHLKEYNTTIMLLKQDAATGINHTNRGIKRIENTRPHFAHEVATGKLYKFISDSFNNKFTTPEGFDPFGSKELAKNELIKLLYFNPKKTGSPSIRYFNSFSNLFPSVAAVIELLKLRKFQDFSVLLQKLESTILLGHVCKKIFETDSSIPMFTVHDSILTTKEHSEKVERIILETYNDIMGVVPELKKEEMSTKEAHKNFEKAIDKKINKILFDTGHQSFSKKVTFTLDDINDITKSGVFKKKDKTLLPDNIVTITFPWLA